MTPPKPASTKKPKRGDVVLVPFPNSNLRTAKVRPALAVQADNLQTGLAQVIVAMITSQVSRANHPCRVKILRATYEDWRPVFWLIRWLWLTIWQPSNYQ
jgi:mRNA interferase MazF